MVHIQYRKDIDGLRSLAILPVVLFHAGIPLFSGGYVGVDVFFVISGYLITSIIFREQESGNFSLSEFWARRARRILPAMMLVIAAILVSGWFVLAPLDYQDLGRAVRYQAFFSSNIYFWQSAGYFDTASELKPLLHMWSLAVEEQFYLLFPFICLILAIPTVKPYRLLILSVLLLLSLGGSIYYMASLPDAVFYLPHARAWELLCGSMLACLMLDKRFHPGFGVAQVGALFGLSLVLIPVFFYQPDTIFPGLAALPPVLGTALLIWSNAQKTWVASLLSIRPLVGVGLISYSLYLWHWPLFAFANYMILDEMTFLIRGVLVVASFVLAYASWRWIENPVRHSGWLRINKKALWISGLSILLVAVAGQLIRKNEGYPERLPEEARRYAMDREWLKHQTECVRRDLEEVVKQGSCTLDNGDGDFEPRFLAWGDSHNASVMPALESLGKAFGVDGLFAARSACLPLMFPEMEVQTECDRFNQLLYKTLNETGIKHLFLAARWSSPLYGEEFYQAYTPVLSESDFELKLRSTLEALRSRGVSVWLMSEVPLQQEDVAVKLTKLALVGEATEGVGRRLSEHRSRQSFIFELFSQLEKEGLAKVLRPDDYLCSGGYCRAEHEGHSLYKDTNHLSVYGAEYISGSLNDFFESL